MLLIKQEIKSLNIATALEGTAVVTAGLFVVNVLSYVLQVILGRNLSPDDFGVFTALLSVAVIVSVFSSAVVNSIIKLVSELKAKGNFEIITRLFWSFSAAIFLSGLFISFLLIVLRFKIADYLNISQTDTIAAFAVYLAISLVSILPSAYFQGLLRFRAYTVFAVLQAVLRVAVPIALVMFGYRVGGAYVGMGIGLGLSYLLSLFLLRKSFKVGASGSLASYYRRFLKIGVGVVLVSLGLVFLNNVDVLLVKHFFDGSSAGTYAALVTVSKVFLFGAGTVFIVMFPQISELYAKGVDYTKPFKNFLLIQLLAIFLGLLIFSFLPAFITQLMFGDKFLAAAVYLPRFSIFIALYVLTSFMIMFFLAINKPWVFVLQFISVACQLVLISFNHDNISNVIDANIIAGFILMTLIVLYYAYDVRLGNHTRF